MLLSGRVLGMHEMPLVQSIAVNPKHNHNKKPKLETIPRGPICYLQCHINGIQLRISSKLMKNFVLSFMVSK